MPDNWSFVAAAYGLTGLVLGLYWRHLVRKEKEVTTAAHTERTAVSSSSDRQTAERRGEPSRTAHPRREPGSPHSLP
jgi:hypothetical protein